MSGGQNGSNKTRKRGTTNTKGRQDQKDEGSTDGRAIGRKGESKKCGKHRDPRRSLIAEVSTGHGKRKLRDKVRRTMDCRDSWARRGVRTVVTEMSTEQGFSQG
jgi:hypothetical protein